MSVRRRPPTPLFLVLCLAFLALGITGQRPFYYIGIVFLVVGVANLLRRHRGDG